MAKLLGAMLSAAVLAMGGPALAQATLPTTVVGTGAQVTPSNAWTYFQTRDLSSSVRPGGAEPDVVRLAAALGNDPDRIYAFVHDEIDVIPLFGLKAGFRGAIIDKAGTPFDQAHLMVELLRAAGYTAAYQLGTIRLTAAEVGDWLGVSDPTAISQLLSNGGFPWTTVVDGGVTKYEIMHLWVRVTIGGTVYVFDPSYKSYTVTAGISDLDGAMGFSGNTFLYGSGGTGGATTGAVTATDNGTARVRGMSRSNVQSYLQACSVSLQSYMQTNLPNGSIDDVVGGRHITAYSGGALRQTALPKQNTLYTTFANDVAPAFRTKVTISYSYNGGQQQGQQVWYADEIYGEQIVFKPVTHKAPADPESFILMRGDTAATDWLPGIVPAPTITVDHPYAASSGAYMDRSVGVSGASTGSLQLVLGFGKTSPDFGAWQERRTSPAEDFTERLYDQSAEAYSVQGSQTATRRRMGAAYLAQLFTSADMIGRVGKAVVQVHDVLGFVTATPYPVTAAQGGIGATTFHMGIEAGISAESLDGSATKALTVQRTTALMMAVLEGNIAEQIGDSPYAGSTPAKLDWAIDGDATTDNRWFYLATPSNWSWVSSQILSDFDSTSPVKDIAAAYIAQGYSLVIPRSSNLGPGPATLQICIPHQGGPVCSIQGPDRGGAFIAMTSDGASIAHIIAKQYGMSKGGGGGDDAEIQPGRVFAVPEDFQKRQYTARADAYSVDLKSGVVTYTPPADLTVGNGGYPYSLSYQRSFQSGPIKSDLGYEYGNKEAYKPEDELLGESGWSSNLHHKILPSSDGYAAFGRDDPRRAAQMVVAIRAMLSVGDDGSSDLDKLERQITANMTAYWASQTVLMNTMTVVQGHDSRSFVRLADGTWSAPPGRDETFQLTNTRQLRQPTTGPAWWAYDQLCAKITGADRSVSYYGIWNSGYTTCTPPTPSTGVVQRQLAKVLEFHHQVFPYGVIVDQDDTGIWNNLGRRIDVTKDVQQAQSIFAVTDHADTSRHANFTVTYNQNPADFFAAVAKLVVTDPEGHAWTFEETAASALRPAGFEARAPSAPLKPFFRFDYESFSRGQVAQVTDANGNVTGYKIASLRAGAVIDPYGDAAYSRFDAFGQPTAVTNRLGDTTRTTYDNHRRVASVTRPEGDQDVFAYDARNNLLSTTRHAKPGSGLSDIVTSATYHSYFNVPLTEIDARNKVTSHSYDASTGRLLTTTQPPVTGGTPVWSYSWNSYGQRVTKTDPTGITTRYGYDAASHYLTSVVVADGTLNLTTTLGYDPSGNINSLTDPRGKVHTASWDRMRRITGWTAPASTGAQTQWVYDVDGLLSQVRQATGVAGDPWAITAYAYEPTAQVAAITDADGRTTHFTYDRLNRLVLTIDPKGRTSGAVYDVEGQVLQTRRGDGSALAQAYETRTYTANGKLATYMDAGGGKTAFGYDGFDRLIATTFPDPSTGLPSVDAGRMPLAGADYEALTYDAASNVTSRRTRDGKTISFSSYDDINRLITKAVPAGGVGSADTVTYGYDLAGRQTSVSDTLGHSLTSHYDQAGRVDYVDTAGPQWSGTKRVSYGYDAASNRTQLTWPDSWSVTYAYDDLNRLSSATDSGGASLATYSYNPLSQRTGVTLPGAAGSESAVFSKAGDLTSLTQSWASGGGVTTAYAYDASHKAVSATWSDSAYQWSPGLASTTAYNPDKLNRYASVGGTSYSYDGNQSLTGDGTWTYGYDAENRLLSASKTGTSATYSYDPLGRRAGKSVTVGGTTTTTAFLHDGDEEIADYSGTGTLLKRYVPSNATDRPIVQIDGAGNKLWFRTDRQGTVIAMTDASGVRQEGPYSYDPYGKPNVTTGTAFRYTGRRYDAETGLYYYRARYYSPGLGRFLQADPVGYDGSANVYLYADDDPANESDPTGLIPLELYDDCRDGHCTSPEQAQKNAQWVRDHPGEILQGTGTVLSVIPTPPTRVVGTAANVAGTIIRESHPPGTSVPPSRGSPTIKPGASGGPTAGRRFSDKTRAQVKAEDPSATCVYCARSGTGTQVDHATPRSQGGDATVENGQLACPHCNASKGNGDVPKSPPAGYVGPWPPPHWPPKN